MNKDSTWGYRSLTFNSYLCWENGSDCSTWCYPHWRKWHRCCTSPLRFPLQPAMQNSIMMRYKSSILGFELVIPYNHYLSKIDYFVSLCSSILAYALYVCSSAWPTVQFSNDVVFFWKGEQPVMWPYRGHFWRRRWFWPWDSIGDCLVQSAIVCHEHCHFKFKDWIWGAKVVRGWSVKWSHMST